MAIAPAGGLGSSGLWLVRLSRVRTLLKLVLWYTIPGFFDFFCQLQRNIWSLSIRTSQRACARVETIRESCSISIDRSICASLHSNQSCLSCFEPRSPLTSMTLNFQPPSNLMPTPAITASKVALAEIVWHSLVFVGIKYYTSTHLLAHDPVPARAHSEALESCCWLYTQCTAVECRPWDPSPSARPGSRGL